MNGRSSSCYYKSRDFEVNMASSFPSTGRDRDDDRGERRPRKRRNLQEGEQVNRVKKIHLQDNEGQDSSEAVPSSVQAGVIRVNIDLGSGSGSDTAPRSEPGVRNDVIDLATIDLSNTGSMDISTSSVDLSTSTMGVGTGTMGLGTSSMGLGIGTMGLGTRTMGLGTGTMAGTLDTRRLPVRTLQTASVHIIHSTHASPVTTPICISTTGTTSHVTTPTSSATQTSDDVISDDVTNNDVIIVDSEDDTDDDVIIVRETRIPPASSAETFGSTLSMRSLAGDSPGSILGDNMEALATRVNNWTVADARRFLMVTLPIQDRRRNLPRQTFQHQIHPMLIFSALMNNNSGMGSYEDLLDLAERLGPATSNGLSEEEIKAIPTKEYVCMSTTDPSKLSCVICMTEYREHDQLKELPCQHEYHEQCIDPWLKNHKTCPICRHEIQLNNTS